MASDVTTQTDQGSWMETPPRTPALRHMSAKLIESMSWLDKISTPLQGWVHKFYGQPRQPTYRVKDWLNGTWLGHSLHPVLTDVPIGAWTASALLDFVWLANQDEGIARSADILMWTGLGSAVGVAATGLTSWVDTDGAEQRTGMLHGLLNGGIAVMNLGSALLRRTGQRRSAITLSTLAYALTLYSAYLGGELGYSTAVGVNHVAWEGGSDDFVAVMDEDDLQEGKLTRVDAAGIPAVLLKDHNTIYAIAATCSHLGGPLDEGRYEDGVVYCPWHNSGFCMNDGSVANSPAVYAQPTFAVRVRAGKIELRRLEHA
ncbi:MAG TPA: Rieske 2Fe-2S domain-containing protein [Ktedonobacteraceae bacterium]|nr:Rieske 2Fe-2S domain-containing protein [Ktedonobacteraceae bacterium]